jgi:hypothetical protein
MLVYPGAMDSKCSVPIWLPNDSNLHARVVALKRVRQGLAEPCYHHDKPL